ncbi:MAG: hypothetical protein ACI4W2_02100 [Eubacterium sp.]
MLKVSDAVFHLIGSITEEFVMDDTVSAEEKQRELPSLFKLNFLKLYGRAQERKERWL